MSEEKVKSNHFIEDIIEEDIENGKHVTIATRFPPEPNGFLHIGHCKAIWINFSMAQKYGGTTNLRFDDTNPITEKTSYVDAIKKDIEWLGYEWNGEALFASNYFDELYGFAVKLINSGDAYIDESSADEIAEMKGVPTSPGKESPYRNRSKEESLDLFEKMKNGEFEDGAMVLRAKVDMSSPNMHMRDPVIYRIKHAHHHRTGDKWCIYPMYDFAHGQSDSLENITHSLCSLEFTHHRPLYNWFIEKLGIYPSRQIEFARMNVAYMITSKRKLLKLVEAGLVSGWDDPRMPTISGMRKRGYPPEAILEFCEATGVAKRDNVQEIELLESAVRNVLNQKARRAFAVMDPIKLTIKNFPEGETLWIDANVNDSDESMGKRKLAFTRNLWIEREDFMLDPPKKYFRLAIDKFVRLKNGFIIQGLEYKTDSEGNVNEVIAEYFPNSKSGEDVSGIKAKGTLHWVAQEHAVDIEVREYDRLFMDPTPTSHEGKDYLEFVNPDSLTIKNKIKAEPSLVDAKLGEHYQFMRKGYYILNEDSSSEDLVFNRTITMRDSWAKMNKK